MRLWRGNERRGVLLWESLGKASWDSAFRDDMIPMAECHLKTVSPWPISVVRLKPDITLYCTDLWCEELGTFTVGKTVRIPTG